MKYLALGIHFELGLSNSIGIENIDVPQNVADNIKKEMGTTPSEIFIICNSSDGPSVIKHWRHLKDYTF